MIYFNKQRKSFILKLLFIEYNQIYNYYLYLYYKLCGVMNKIRQFLSFRIDNYLKIFKIYKLEEFCKRNVM